MNAKESIKNSVKILLFFTLLTGLIYPVIISGIGQMLFSIKANGSMLTKNDQIVGSRLIGQKFTSKRYFWPRPSAIDYNPMPSGGSNLALTSKVLVQQYNDNKAAFIKDNLLKDTASVPSDVLFASASGVDPDISKEAAVLQVKRICEARKFNAEKKQVLLNLIDKQTEKRQLGFLGEEVVNVLVLNIKLDEISK
ncbi:MAG: potassium-transporting ATPase subunit KdpC [Ignavibacteriaceae bacterium]|nr:potassium-transporting ATPase subunit KdpC [Ignavibacteriaceae bacterium]